MKVKNIPIGFLAVLDEQVLEELVHDNHEASVAETATYEVDGPKHDPDFADLATDRTVFAAQSQPVGLKYEPEQSPHSGLPLRRSFTPKKRTRSVLVSTTDMGLARDICAAVRRAQSELDNLQQKGVRVVWGH